MWLDLQNVLSLGYFFNLISQRKRKLLKENAMIGLSFERPYLMEGLNVMQPKYDENHKKKQFSVKTTVFGKNHVALKIAVFNVWKPH